MNTNGNVYTVVYTTIIVVLVAAILAFASQSLKSRQEANIKAETISQMLAAAQFASKEDLSGISNDAVLDKYAENIENAFTVNAKGEKVSDLSIDRSSIEVADGLKAENKLIGQDGLELPVYIFNKDSKKVTVVPVYGAGLWGPVWGYIALDEDLETVLGAYFDHESETPGLGGKIKDDPSFRAKFVGKKLDLGAEAPLSIVKNAAGSSQIDAISGATMTSKGLSAAIGTWLGAYKPYLEKARPETGCSCCEGECAEDMSCCEENENANE